MKPARIALITIPLALAAVVQHAQGQSIPAGQPVHQNIIETRAEKLQRFKQLLAGHFQCLG